mmetsp:Transcript_45525/g.131877  ORF Transcript_45525/g.131877 Transcript_45525/m.131877 type:complete len:394 (-) Transcript_45525:48-1229(-)
MSEDPVVAFSDPQWLGKQLGRSVASVSSEALSAAGGWSGNMTRFCIQFEDGTHGSYVLKSTKVGREAFGKSMGLFREAFFYLEFASTLTESLAMPRVLYARGDPDTGVNVVFMEDLSSAVQSGYFFGKGSPHNWDKDLAALTKGWQLEPAMVTTMAFTQAAQLHSAFWRREELVSSGHSWLRGAKWLVGEDESSWTEYQKQASDAWAAVKASLQDGSCKVQWQPEVVACVDASLAKSKWAAFQAELQTRPWTLVHGDFHPANMMVRPGPGGDAEGAALVLLDFEQVGVGSGPQELGQYLISHCEPRTRATIERGAVEEYYRLMCSQNSEMASSMSWEACWEEYKHGGVGRWMWFLPILAGMCKPEQQQYFHDQVAAFIQDHGIDATNVPMARV